MLPNHYFTEKYVELHQWERQRQAEQARLVASVRPYWNVAQYAVSKLGNLLLMLGSWMKQPEKAERSPRPVTGSL